MGGPPPPFWEKKIGARAHNHLAHIWYAQLNTKMAAAFQFFIERDMSMHVGQSLEVQICEFTQAVREV